MKKKDRDLVNSTNHVEALEDTIRDMKNKMDKLEQDRQRAQDELKVQTILKLHYFQERQKKIISFQQLVKHMKIIPIFHT